MKGRRRKKWDDGYRRLLEFSEDELEVSQKLRILDRPKWIEYWTSDKSELIFYLIIIFIYYWYINGPYQRFFHCLTLERRLVIFLIEKILKTNYVNEVNSVVRHPAASNFQESRTCLGR